MPFTYNMQSSDLAIIFALCEKREGASQAFLNSKQATHSFQSTFCFKLQQMVNEAQNKESFEEQSEPTTYNDWLETSPIAKIACFQDRGGKSIPNNKMI